MPSVMKPKWLSEVRPISRRMSSWPMARNAPYTIEIRASVTTTGVAHCDASGKSPRQKRSIPNVPILSSTQTSSTLVPGVAFSVVSASQVCSGKSGALTANAIMKPTKSQRSALVLMSSCWRSEIRYDGSPSRAETTYSPITAASRTRPPPSWYIRNFSAAKARPSRPKPPIRKYAGISVASKTT